MGSLDNDPEARMLKLRGQAAALRAAGDTSRKLGDSYYRAGSDLHQKADRKDAKADLLVRELVALAITDAANEERFRAATAVPAEEEN